MEWNEVWVNDGRSDRMGKVYDLKSKEGQNTDDENSRQGKTVMKELANFYESVLNYIQPGLLLF